MTVLITLTTAGSDTGPFNIYSNSNGFSTIIISGVSRASLVAGYNATVPDGTTEVLVRSTGACQRDLYLDVSGAPATTTSTTSSTTSTSTTEAPIVPTIYLGQPICKYNNCNDNAACAVVYDIIVNNAPPASYVELVTTFPASTANVSLTDTQPSTARILYYEPSGSATPVYFTIQLKLGSTVLAYSDTSLTHQSFWQFLNNCS
jgi:hypothetical protein